MTEPAPPVPVAERPEPAPRVVVLADDLIWATRLADAVAAAGGVPRRIRRLEDLAGAVAPPALAPPADGPDPVGRAIVDLTARAYDGVEAIRVAVGTGARVVAVGQHDDVALRRSALAAGAERVFTYRALFEDGRRALAAWLAR